MLIQTSSPRPILNVGEFPSYIVIHTLRKAGISNGAVTMNVNVDVEHGKRESAVVAEHEVFPIEGEPGFEGVEYYLPFDLIFGTKKTEYDETRLLRQINDEAPKRVNTDEPRARIGDTMLALHMASGVNVIAKSAYRVEGAKYAERVFNFQLLFPVTGGGIVRVTSSDFDVTNPTFDPKAAVPRDKPYQNITLLEAFNRTHKPTSPDIEARKRARVAAAEASMRAADKQLPPAGRRALPPKKSDE